jgi:hypothetical protein
VHRFARWHFSVAFAGSILASLLGPVILVDTVL